MTWREFILEEMRKPYFKKLNHFLIEDRKAHRIFPEEQNVFKAFDLTPFDNTRVVILGMDPYHTPGAAHGLAFSVLPDVKTPPSLQNIFKELKNDLDIPIPKTGYLNGWAKQGVLLINATLTVRNGYAGSHQGKGWEVFTDAVISRLNADKENLVFVLWGAFARSKKKLITNKSHLVLESVHPSPLSAYGGFFGSRPFSSTNSFLKAHGIVPIDWHLTDE